MLARFIRCSGAALVLAFLMAPSIFAQGATGKIQGRVVDAQTGEPIAGATVRVLGTTRGGLSGSDGYYFINEVPAGLRTILAEFIGRRTFRIENQRVLAGQTLTLDFQLDIAAIEVEALVVEGERNPLVPRDQVSSKSIVTGDLVDALPVDNIDAVVSLQPGVITANCRPAQARAVSSAGAPTATCRTIRGSRANEEAVYVDGVITRRYSSGEAQPIDLPTNSLTQIDVTTGGVGAEFIEAQSGVVNYVTKRGGTAFNGSFTLFTDQISPENWRTGFNRVEATFGGPILPEQNLSFFLAGVAEGQKYGPLNDGFNDVPILVPDGVATMPDGSPAIFNLARESAAPDGTDSVAVPFPNFVEWGNGPTLPFNSNDQYSLVSKLSWGLGGGSSIDFSYKREREQSIALQLVDANGNSELYNPDGFDGTFSDADVFTLGGYFLLKQTAKSAIALDLKASYQSYYDQFGELDPDWLLDHRDPSLGFNFSNQQFLVDADDWPITETLVNAIRSGVMPADSLQVFPGRFDLDDKQSLEGLAENLRSNPYGLRRFFSISGFNNGGLEYRDESDWIFTGNLDLQVGRYNRVRTGGELILIDTKRQRVPLFTATAVPAANEPTRAGLFITDRLDLGDVVIDLGFRWDYFDSDGQYPRVPGFVFNVPDSLKADFVTVEAGEGPILDRVRPLQNCGGDATAPDRTRADGTVVCKNNFIDGDTKSELSPRLGVSFPVTAKSTFRFSYSHNVQVPALQGQSFGNLGAAAGQTALFNDVYADFQGGLANTNALFGRDIDLPRTVLFEAGYRQLIGETLVVDIAAYSKTLRNGLTYRKLPFEDPNVAGQTIFINVLTNADYTQTQGVDLRLDKRFGQFADLTANYSFVNAKGTGSDPFTYTGLLLRRNTNLSIITGAPVVPPDVILPLEQSRKHNIGGTFSLLFPPDFEQGTPLGSILGDFGWFATFRFASGLPFTRLENSANGQVGPPTFAGLGGTPAEELNSSSTSWEKRLDFRFTKGFNLRNTRLRFFVDWRNPFNLSNTNAIYLETGEPTNEAFKDKLVNQQLTDPLLDGDSQIDDFAIMLESPENEFNKFSLMQAESRFGNGDGVFTVAEQRAAFGAQYELFNGPQFFRESNQSLRVGFDIVF